MYCMLICCQLTTHELLLLFQVGLSASLLVIIAWLPVTTKYCVVSLSHQVAVASVNRSVCCVHCSNQPKADDLFQDFLVHI